MLMSKLSVRVYYEDTDAGGVVYYANYLKFAERARTEMLRELSINQSDLLEKDDIIFVVRHVEMDLKKPARLDDVLEVSTSIEKISGASLIMAQEITCNGNSLVNLKVVIASVSSQIKPARLPDWLKEKLSL
jgi:acyl-CoA thioester hydrolase